MKRKNPRTATLLLVSLSLLWGCDPAKKPVPKVELPPVKAKANFNMQTVVYRTVGDKNVELDLYVPNPPQDAFRARPPRLVVLIHGGGWASGSKEELNDLSEYFVGKGFAVANINYRLAPEDIWPAMLEDCLAAVAYLRQHEADHGYDASRIIAGGESAGGHLSMWLAVKGQVSTVLSISGLHDLSLKMTPEGEKYKIVQKALGKNYPADVRDFSPLNYVTSSLAPVYFIHGEKDPWVQFEHSARAESKLKSLGVRTKAVLVSGMGHGIKPKVATERKALDAFVAWASGEAP